MRLEIRLLGPFEVTLDKQPITTFESNKVRALLAYLAAEPRRQHRRESLAGLLWPDWPDKSAMRNLRYALADLRKNIGDRDAQPPFLLISRDSIQLNLESDCWIDVLDFEQSLGQPQPTLNQLQSVVQLYRGDFLEGFSLADSPPFEEWVLAKREYFRRQALKALLSLADQTMQIGDYEQALQYAYRQVELEPYQEEAYRQVMRLLALQGQRSKALAQFEKCRESLRVELGVEPAEETTQLYEQIRSGKLAAPAPLPAFLTQKITKEVEYPLFVARQEELQRLHQALGQALSGKGQVIFITGSPGRGKTSLVQEFIRQVMQTHPELAVAQGNCQAYFGRGDPYLPFREILEMLTGEVEDRWAGGRITQAHALLLWRLSPHSLKLLAEEGPALVDTLLPGNPTLKRAAQVTQGEPAWLNHLRDLVHYRQMSPSGYQSDTEALFSQYSKVVLSLSRNSPLMLFIDDLQWADPGSLSLLFTLGRQIVQGRLLLIGAYRLEDISPNPDGTPHPLAALTQELQLLYGDNLIRLDEAEERQFIEAYLDSEPNQLSPDFRDRLFLLTRGHPLYTVELLRSMRARGELFLDQDHQWEEAPWLNFEILPARVEAAIGERVNHLPERLRELLQVASIQGEWFIAEAVAQIQEINILTLIKLLAGVLERQHRLVRSDSLVHAGDQRLSRYRFHHILIQRYLYNSLDPILRAHLHEQTGTALEELYAAHRDEISPLLARHFEEAGLIPKAIVYLQSAGERAAVISANAEALAHFSHALELTPETDQAGRFKLLLARQRVHHKTGQGEASEQDIRELESIAQELGPLQQAQAALRRARSGEQKGQIEMMAEAAQAAIANAQAVGEVSLEAEGYALLGLANKDEESMQKARDLAHRTGLKSLEVDILRDWGVLTQLDARKSILLSQEALQLYRSLGDRYGEGRALGTIGWSLFNLGEPARALPYYEQSLEICREVGDQFDEMFALLGIAIVYKFLGYRLDEIPAIFIKTIPLTLESKNRELEGMINSNVAEAYRLLGDGERAIPYSERALMLSGGTDIFYIPPWQWKRHADILVDTGQLGRAEEAYLISLQYFREKEQREFINWNLAGLARLALRRGDASQALSYIDEVLSNSSEPIDSHNRFYYLHWDNLTCYQVLHANGDPRAEQALAKAYQTLQEYATRIEDEDMRRSFLENIPWNREIVALWQSRQG